MIMPQFEALVHVVDPETFIKEAYASRNGSFRAATEIEVVHFDGPRTRSAPGEVVSILSEDRLNVEDVLLVDVGMDVEEAKTFIKEVRFSSR